MRILTAIVAPPHLSVSGAARAAERLSLELTRSCDVTVASMMPASAWDRSLVHVPVRTWLPAALRCPGLPNRARTPFYRSDIPELIQPRKFDLVHIHNPMPAMEMNRIAAACRRAGVPYVVSTHGFQEIDSGPAVYGFGPVRRLLWDRLVYRPVARATAAADAVLLLSDADRRVVRRMGSVGCQQFVVPNGVEAPRPQTEDVVSSVMSKFGVSERPAAGITCMFLANHTPNKGLPVLFAALASLTIPFLLIVAGERRQGVNYAGFESALRHGQRAIFTGRLLDEEVTALMRRSDIFVFPSLADTLPLVVQEALAAGLPVIASAVGGIPRQIDRTCGLLVPPGDAKALARAVRTLADNRAALRAMSAAARRRALALPHWRGCADLALDAYRTVLEGRASRRRTTARKAPGAASEPTVEVAS